MGDISGEHRRSTKYPEVMGMETRVAIIGIIVEDRGSTGRLNEILHEYGDYIIGRMGIPYRDKGISIISIAVDAPNDVISAMSGKIGRLPGISAKTAYSKVSYGTDKREAVCEGHTESGDSGDQQPG
jgi:putative iron-only hydrogenase system regulator